MGKNDPVLKEGLGTLFGKLLLFLSGKGKDYKDSKKFLKDPEYKKKLKDLHYQANDIIDQFKELQRKHNEG